MKRFVDETKCDTCDGEFLCVRDCVTSFLEAEKDGTRSYAKFKQRGFCINCGHCNSICPNNAILPLYEPNYNDDILMNLYLMKRTVRIYDNVNEISHEDLNLIIQAGQSSPTEKNKGTVRICFIKEHLKEVFIEALEVLKKHVEKVGTLHPQYSYIMDLYNTKSPILWGAEYAVIIIGKHEFTVDAALAAERMQLMAYARGIGSGYNGNLKFAINSEDSLKEKLEIKNQEEALVCFALGHTNIKYRHPYLSEKKKVSFF